MTVSLPILYVAQGSDCHWLMSEEVGGSRRDFRCAFYVRRELLASSTAPHVQEWGEIGIGLTSRRR